MGDLKPFIADDFEKKTRSEADAAWCWMKDKGCIGMLIFTVHENPDAHSRQDRFITTLYHKNIGPEMSLFCEKMLVNDRKKYGFTDTWEKQMFELNESLIDGIERIVHERDHGSLDALVEIVDSVRELVERKEGKE